MALAWIVKIGKNVPQHWDAAKADGFWDVRTASAFRNLEAGDHVFFWLSGSSFVSWVRATSTLYPISHDMRIAQWVDVADGGYSHRFDFEKISDRITSQVNWSDLQDIAGRNYAPPAAANPVDSEKLVAFIQKLFIEPVDPGASNMDVAFTRSPAVAYQLGEDMRGRALREVQVRQGQPAFRRALLDAYRNRCAVTGTEFGPVLEAAHIDSYYGAVSNNVANGLLLRSDIHALFDLGLWAVSADYTIILSPSLATSEYSLLGGRPLSVPEPVEKRPSLDALARHRNRLDWVNSDAAK